MEVSGQLRTPATLQTTERELSIHWETGLVGPRVNSDMVPKRKILASAWNQTEVIQYVASHYTD
jgi:hypothetical protein